MNIQEAKNQIKQAIAIYLKKDANGDYRIPVERQRPVFLLGAPGIGKTAIMEQIADELDIALVSYSMTHHTRQSALGLPFICHKTYGGTEFDVSEYTMSEIIASVYEEMERTGKTEGILFLDEINCVSETLAPSMLQFLQYKTFGKHRVPKGWIVATAGNPPQFNRSVREFDVVTMDRLKIMEVEADYSAWRTYALNKGLHGAILTYLDIRKDDFYLIESTVDGKAYVTARGWEDLSEAIALYEESSFAVDETLIGQYLRSKRICREFASYYDLYEKYKKDYRVHQILAGDADAEIRERAKKARFDERISLIGLLLDAILTEIRDNVATDDALRERLVILREQKLTGETEDFALIKDRFEADVLAMQKEQRAIKEKLSNLFRFVEKIYGAGNEMLILVTDLTVNASSAKFIARCGCAEYDTYNKKFQIYERQKEIEDAIEQLKYPKL